MRTFYLLLLSLLAHANKGQELLVLGTAQDAGKPQIACKKACCSEGSVEGKVVSIALLDTIEKRYVLLEIGPDITAQLQMIPAEYPALPHYAGLSHAHIGHYTGLMYFGREACNAQQIPLICGPRMDTFLRENGPWSQLVKLGNIDPKPVSPKGISTNQLPEDWPFKIQVFTVPHRDEFSETLGYLISGPKKKALFIPDIDKWEKWDYRLEEMLVKVDYAFLDATFFDGDELPGRNMSEIPHPFVVETMELLRSLPLAERSTIHFIHLNHSNPLWNENSDAHLATRKSGFLIAKEGQTLKL